MKNAKIIQINGIGGLIKAVFIGICLAAGFVGFPGYVAKHVWNSYLTEFMPAINLGQGILLWVMAVIIYFIVTKRGFSVKFASPEELDEEEINLLMKKVQLQSQARKINEMMLKSFEDMNKEQDEKSCSDVSDNKEE